MTLKNLKKLDWQRILNWAYAGMIGVVVLSAAYGIGTFVPNEWATKKIVRITEVRLVEEAKTYGFHEPEFRYTDQASFIRAVDMCVNYLNMVTEPHRRIPSAIIISMAMIESANGTSRFAVEGNALFGVRTWDPAEPQMKPLQIPNAKFGVKKYMNKCESVADVIAIVNRHPAYKDFREERDRQVDRGSWNYIKLVPHLTAWSTNPAYPDLILNGIKENSL
jgi:hypothetical protein